jgi:tetratricopeptide (TPR) repeat protein
VYDRIAESPDDADPVGPMTHHLAGAAAQRLGLDDAAQRYWKEALRLAPDFSLTKDNLEDLKRPIGERNGPWSFTLVHWIDAATLREGAKLLAAPDSPGPEGVLQQYPCLELLAPILLERGDEPSRLFAITLAKAARTPALLAALREFALSKHGTDEMRLVAASAAAEAGLIESGKQRMWLRGEWTEATALGFEIYHEPTPRTYSEEVLRLAERAMEAIYVNPARAVELLKQALRMAPDAPDLLNNLANAYRLQGRPAEADALILDLRARFPDYFFGIVGVSHILRGEGRLDEAEELLKPLTATDRMHISEFTALAQAQVELLMAREDPGTARHWYDMWRRVSPDHPGLARYFSVFDQPAARVSKPTAGVKRRLPG